MSKILLLIRRPGKPDHAEVHPDREAARAALFRYVRDHWRFNDMRCPADQETAIRIFFTRSPTTYVLVGVEQGSIAGHGQIGEA
ncbi:hypothetical protein ABIC35_003870 [Sphingomonas trueperi]